MAEGMMITSSNGYAAGSPMLMDSNLPGTVISPAVINPFSVLTAPAYWRAIAFLADNLASFPRTVRREGKKLDVPHPLDKVLRRKPNQCQNSYTFWQTAFFHFRHWGNGYIRIRRGDRFNVTALENLLPDNVMPFRYRESEAEPYQQFFYVMGKPNEIVPAADIIHLAALSYDGMTGFNSVWVHREAFQRSLMADRYQTRFLMKGTMLRGAVEIPTGVSDDEVKGLLSVIQQFFRGTDADRDLIILPAGAKLSNAALAPKDCELGTQLSYNVKQISQITGVPPHFLFEDSESKYNGNVEQSGQDVVRYTFRPLIEAIEDELSAKLLTEAEQAQDYRIHLDPAALLRGDTQTTSAVIANEVKAGLRTRNEGRAALGLPPDSDPESDKLKVLGDSTPAKPIPATSAATSPKTMHAALRPLVEDACQRVDAKTDKAFAARSNKPEAERAAWGTTFADEQARYVTTALAPIAAVFRQMTGEAIDVAAIAGLGRNRPDEPRFRDSPQCVHDHQPDDHHRDRKRHPPADDRRPADRAELYQLVP